MNINYMTTKIGNTTHDSKMNDKIQLVLSELIESNTNNVETSDTIHIFIDINNYNNSIEYFIENVHKYLSKYIKIYFLRSCTIMDYTNVVLVSKDNIEALKIVVNIQKEVAPMFLTNGEFRKYLNDKKIVNYEVYCWKNIDSD
jgi:hypothetical protein